MPDITEKEAKKRAKSYTRLRQLFIILTVKQADMIHGSSTPFIGIADNGEKFLLLFSREEFARKFVEDHQFEILDGVYPVGSICPKDRICGLESLTAIARTLGIDSLDFNDGFEEQELRCKTQWFANVFKYSKASMRLTKDEVDNITASAGNVPVHFNSIPILHFTNPFALSSVQKQSLVLNVLSQNSTEKLRQTLLYETLFECCFTMDSLTTNLIPNARSSNKPELVQFLETSARLLREVLMDKLSAEKNLFTLVDSKTGTILEREGYVYILYTDRFRYMGAYEYRKIELPVRSFLTAVHAAKILITDGPYYMAPVDLAQTG